MEREFRILDHYIKAAGLLAAQATLPEFEWHEIKKNWRTIGTTTRLAALVLRRNQLTEKPSLVMATEIATLFFGPSEVIVYGNGDVERATLDGKLWNRHRLN